MQQGERRRVARLAAVAGLVLAVAVVAWMAGRRSQEGVTPTGLPEGPALPAEQPGAAKEVPEADPYAWPEGHTWPADLPAVTYSTKEAALKAVLTAVFDPRGPRRRDLAAMTCRAGSSSPYGVRMFWEGAFTWDAGGVGMGLPRTLLTDFPAIVADSTPDAVEWRTVREGVQGDPLVSADSRWRTKPEVPQVREVLLNVGFRGPRRDHPEDGWCLIEDRPRVQARGD